MNNITDWRAIDASTLEGSRALDRVIAQRIPPYMLPQCDVIFRYSANPSCAIELLDNTCPRWTVDIDYSAPANKRYTVSTFYKGEWRVGVAETLALAICFAYLEYTDAQAASGEAGE